ncbi:MAG: 8-amino-7-oxononanoate synthase [Kofleriaceae bacterium]|nr:8-amino-7-oxononanoate synthase [Myxococcales bacterium]MCB9559493.1 8-amino-7-oxononanoate synthase [Kofleriaceae bacterium]
MSALDFLDDELAALEARHRRRWPRVVSSAQGARVRLDGREVVSFSSNDYLGLAGHPAIRDAARDAVARWGVGAGASRLIVGNTEVHEELERALAAMSGTPAARLFNSGFAANTGLLPVLAGPEDEIFSDELNHASIIDGCRLSRARIRVYPHNNVSKINEMASSGRPRRRLIVTESVFSMDGDRAPLAELRAAADALDAILVVDHAHGGGVDDPAEVRAADVVVGTLGKAFGVYGAWVAGPVALAGLLWNRARSLVFTTGLPPAVAAAGLAAVRLVSGPEGDARRARLRARIDQAVVGLRALGIEVPGSAPILPVVVGPDDATMWWTERMLEQGLYVQGVRPPTVPEGTARLRITLSADHSEEDVGRLVTAIREGLAAGGVVRST